MQIYSHSHAAMLASEKQQYAKTMPPTPNATVPSIIALARQHGLPRLTVRRLERLLRNSTTTIPDLALYFYHLAIAGEHVWKLAAYERLVSREKLLAAAEASEARRCDDKRRSRLDGFPVSLKGNLAVAEYPLTAGSRILDTANAVGYDATVSQRLLRHSGALWMGATTLDEFGMGSLGTNVMTTKESTTKATRNPLPLLKQNSVGNDDTWSNDNWLAQLIKLPEEGICEIHEHLLTQNSHAEDDLDFVTGGSSSGSAAAVAHGSSLISLGSDTGGSVRLPAAWCGLVGYKPTYGLLPRHGLVAYASSLDTVGVLASSVQCAAAALDCLMLDLSQSDLPPVITDSTQTRPAASFLCNLRNVSNADRFLAKKQPSAPAALSLPLAGIRVGIPAAFCVAECSEQVTQAWDDAAQFLETQGAAVEVVGVEQISAEVLQKSLASYYILACAEASSNLARYDGFRYGNAATEQALTKIFSENADTGDSFSVFSSILELQYAAARTTGFGREVQRRLLLGTSVLSSDRFHKYYEGAAKVRAVLTHQLHRVLKRYDLLLVPTCVSTAPPRLSRSCHNENDNNQSEVELDATVMLANDVMTVPISLSGLPAISVPFRKRNGSSSSDRHRVDAVCSSSAAPENGAEAIFRPGLQLVAGVHGDVTLMHVAALLQEAAL